MNEIFSVTSPIVFATLVLLILLSIATWSIALFKLWKQWEAKKYDREFNDSFWSAREWKEAEKATEDSQGDIARLAQAGFAELKTLNEVQQDLKHLGAPRDVLIAIVRNGRRIERDLDVRGRRGEHREARPLAALRQLVGRTSRRADRRRHLQPSQCIREIMG